eukprot:483935_1
MNYVFAVSYLTNYIKHVKNQMNVIDNVNICIIPNKVISMLNRDIAYEHNKIDIDNIDSSFQTQIHINKMEANDLNSIYTHIVNIYKHQQKQRSNSEQKNNDIDNKILIIVDRRNVNDDLIHFMVVDENYHGDHLCCNYVLTICFFINYLTNIVKCYLWWAVFQKVRFFPETVMYIIPKLFDKHLFRGSQRKRVELIHSHNFKNGWRIDLNDPRFNKWYKILTGYDHVSVNYHETVMNGDDEKEEKYDSNIEEFAHCNKPLNDCDSVKYLLNILQQFPAGIPEHFNDNIDNNTFTFNSELLSNSYDHMIIYHALFVDNAQKLKIQNYFISVVGRCVQKEKCLLIEQHINRNIESTDDDNKNNTEDTYINYYVYRSIFNSIHSYILHPTNELYRIRNATLNTKMRFTTEVNKDDQMHEELKLQVSEENDFIDSIFIELDNNNIVNINSFKHWIEQNEYDQESIQSDIIFLQHSSNIKCYFLTKYNEEKTNQYYEVIKQLSIKQKQKEKEEKTDVFEINFGQNVLVWLLYNESPFFLDFKTEIIKNPHSTISEQKYNELNEQVKIKIKSRANGWTQIELLSLKIYTDTTDYQSSLRKAFWYPKDDDDVENKKLKRYFYHWGITLYQTFLRHGGPPPIWDNKSTKPMTLYHGLNQVFAIKSSIPYYNGIISTSINETVANQFSDNSGLIWSIQGSYINQFKSLIGISTDWFSQYKNESEFILFNSFIPIDKTINFANTIDDKINIFLKQLQIYDKRILNVNLFYKQLGIELQSEWIPIIENHPKLFNSTVMSQYPTVLHRLSI